MGEGFDLPALDTVYLTVPSPNPQRLAQVVGRVLRPSEGKAEARIVDFVDPRLRLLQAWWRRRREVYRGWGFRVDAEPVGPF